jgi:hypothetical protein
MPALFQEGAVVYYGAFKKHLGLFPPVEDAALLAQVAAYAGPKGNLQFPYAQPMPHALIAAVVQARVRCQRGQGRPGPDPPAGNRPSNPGTSWQAEGKSPARPRTFPPSRRSTVSRSTTG